MFFSETRKKKKATKVFLAKLPTDLKNRYGVKAFYTLGQLESTLTQKYYPQSFQDYAFASFLNEEEAIEKFGSSDQIQSLRADVANWFFEGDINYVAKLTHQRQVGNEAHCSERFVDD